MPPLQIDASEDDIDDGFRRLFAQLAGEVGVRAGSSTRSECCRGRDSLILEETPVHRGRANQRSGNRGWNSGSCPRPAHAAGLPARGRLWPHVPLAVGFRLVSLPLRLGRGAQTLSLIFTKTAGEDTRVSHLYCVNCPSRVASGCRQLLPRVQNLAPSLVRGKPAHPIRAQQEPPSIPVSKGQRLTPQLVQSYAAPAPSPRRQKAEGTAASPPLRSTCAHRGTCTPRGVLATESWS